LSPLRLFVLSALVSLALVCAPSRGGATEPPAVPPALQMQLITKVASYDRHLPERAKGLVRIALVHAPNDAVSEHTANQARVALADLKLVGGLPHTEVEVRFESAQALRDACTAQRFSIIYLAPGLSEHTTAIRAALDGADVLTATSTPGDVERGIVLGIDLSAGRSQLLFNLPQARQQHVDVGAEVLRMMTVYR
jgi:YfiR/HmsC-like